MSVLHAHRRGFTLVEMMVAMALTVFVMVILSQCFVAGLETFSGLKAIGDMQEQLRTATNMLRADLSADHFEGKRRRAIPT
jgi:prepilin-type N-terminal cleavage/methylation domain-containing protein